MESARVKNVLHFYRPLLRQKGCQVLHIIDYVAKGGYEMRRIFLVLFLAAVLAFSTFANASLVDYGGGFIYDTDRNITWYDAPVAYTNWNDSMAWAAGLTKGGVSGWQLPSTVGATTEGYNITTSDLGHLYYTELGNTQSSHLMNAGPFQNLQHGGDAWYWSSTEYAPGSVDAFIFSFYDGKQYTNYKGNSHYVLAVHEGNVAVPIPRTILLFAPGLAGIALFRRRIGRCM